MKNFLSTIAGCFKATGQAIVIAALIIVLAIMCLVFGLGALIGFLL